MVTIESQWFSNETHCEQGPGNYIIMTIIIIKMTITLSFVVMKRFPFKRATERTAQWKDATFV